MTLCCFAHTVLTLSDSGQVCEMATKRLQEKMGTLKDNTSWSAFLPWIVAQPHLDYHADQPFTKQALYQRFLTTNKEAQLYGNFRSERGKTLYNELSRNGNSINFMNGVKAALNASGSSALTQLTQGRVSKAFAAGVTQVATQYSGYLTAAFEKDLSANYGQVPDLRGKKSADALAALAAAGLGDEIVHYIDAAIPADLVTDSYPAPGGYLQAKAVVTLYITQ